VTLIGKIGAAGTELEHWLSDTDMENRSC